MSGEDVLGNGTGDEPANPKSHPRTCELLKRTQILEPSTTTELKSGRPETSPHPQPPPSKSTSIEWIRRPDEKTGPFPRYLDGPGHIILRVHRVEEFSFTGIPEVDFAVCAPTEDQPAADQLRVSPHDPTSRGMEGFLAEASGDVPNLHHSGRIARDGNALVDLKADRLDRMRREGCGLRVGCNWVF